MMNNIQKYIDLLKSEKEKAKIKEDSKFRCKEFTSAAYFNGQVDAFSFMVNHAELLLNSENEKQR